jgi:hypothetical protein
MMVATYANKMVTGFAAAAMALGSIAPAYADEKVASNTDPANPSAVALTVTKADIDKFNGRLKELAPIIRGAHAERTAMGVSEADSRLCSAQTSLFAESFVSFRDKPGREVYLLAVKDADMKELIALTKLATCTLTNGEGKPYLPSDKFTSKTKPALNFCSDADSVATRLVLDNVFDPRRFDNRETYDRCPELFKKPDQVSPPKN